MGTKKLSPNGDLTSRQMRFAYEYAKDHNGTQAAIRAGYNVAGASVEACRFLLKPSIQALIRDHEANALAAAGITREKVLRQLGRLAFLDPKKFYDENGKLKKTTDLDDDTAACLTGMEVEDQTNIFDETTTTVKKIKFSDMKGALDSLAKMEGMNAPDKVAVLGKIESVVTIQRG